MSIEAVTVMIRIAIVDDEKQIRKQIFAMISKYFIDNALECKVLPFSDGQELIDSGLKFDIIFMDIEMKNVNGIQAAQHIRKSDMNVPIVYITGYVDYWRRAYKVHAFDFISKPASQEQIDNVLNDFFSTVYKKNKAKISLATDDGMLLVNLDEIRYFNIKEKKKVVLSNLTGKNIIVKENIGDIYERLNKDMFFMPHRCCIVNFRYVKEVTKDRLIIMDNGDFFPLSQRKKQEFMKLLSQNIVSSLSGR